MLYKMEKFKVPILPNSVGKLEAQIHNKEQNDIEENVSEENKPIVCNTTEESKSKTCNCPYKIPQWSAPPSKNCTYYFEILKSGQIIGKINNLEEKAFWTFGRLQENDIEMAHPTISRFHSILQYKPFYPVKHSDVNGCGSDKASENVDKDSVAHSSAPEGWYVYDLGSTHGTFLNKQRLPTRVYIRIRVGHILRLGGSSRSYILQGPAEDEEPESELTVTELRNKRLQELEDFDSKRRNKTRSILDRLHNDGCSWGMTEDADEETDLSHNPYAMTNNEELFLDDPKKTLRGYFEREGSDLEYKCNEISAGSFMCRIELPLDDSNGRPIVAEVIHKGRKKECVLQCALEACRILDRYGVLRQANQEPQRRKFVSKSNDSDDDEFLDRTGDIARKKQRKESSATNTSLTYADLLKQKSDISKKLDEIRNSIAAYQQRQKLLKTKTVVADNDDDLDSYIENMQEERVDKTEMRKLRLEEQRLIKELDRNKQLIQLAKPLDIEQMFGGSKELHINNTNNEASNNLKRNLPLIGKRNQMCKFKVIKSVTTTKSTKHHTALDAEEADESDDDKPSNFTCKDGQAEGNGILNKLQLPADKSKCYGPAGLVPTEILHNYNENEMESNHTSKQDEQKEVEVCDTNNDNSNAANPALKKRRQRMRQRGKRFEVDIDEDDEQYEPIDKYAKWLPPTDQTGDGYTKLNAKYGY